MNSSHTEIVEIHASDKLDRVHFSVRNPNYAHDLRRMISKSYPEIKFHRDPLGFWTHPMEALKLCEVVEDNFMFNWDTPSSQLINNRQHIINSHEQLFGDLENITSHGKPEAQRLLADVDGLDILDDHQLVNVACMTSQDGVGLCLFDEQGAGKTVSAIYTYDVLVERDEIDFALVISPKSMVPEWQNDFIKFKGDLYVTSLITGTRREKSHLLRQNADVMITNFETVVSILQELTSLIRLYNGRSILFIDESFFVKNLNTKRTRAIKQLREWFGRAFVLCGTPAPNSPHDLVEQFNLVDFGSTFYDLDIPKERDRARPIIQDRIEEKGLYVRHLKSKVLPDLPGKRFQKIILDLEPVQESIYLSILNDLITDLESISDHEFLSNLASYLARRNALLRVCSNPLSLVPDYKEIPTKHIALDNILNQLIDEQGEKVILWSFYRASIDDIMNRYGSKYSAVRYDGSITDTNIRRNSIKQFQEDDQTMMFVANPAAAGAGLTLHRARFAIYESMSNQAAHYLQSLDRIHRRGQTRDVEYLILLCKDTIEINEFDLLLEKERAGKGLLGDPKSEKATRESMLFEAISLLKKIQK